MPVSLIDWACENSTSESLLQSEAPPTMAMSIRPNCKAGRPACIACSDEAQAELIAMNGPVRPNAFEIVPATMLVATSGESAARCGIWPRTVSTSSRMIAS